ncbi:transposase, IS4 family protein [Sphaerospermopsis reniformis]|jgi:transposase|uniref:Transposase, IS4 family protein n=1 Tax=Sphaerospermopsis reniformis TaxID=531300 RepID=A0A480A7N1_9CYAN|nr:transposase [Sphaerospermopsis kisseleviana NIES-73]GCL39211.1 transposase, IS4 family protein [Sphaerospermopsis reniformis]
MNASYPSNLTSQQWELLSGLILEAKKGGRKRSVDMEAVVNAILYILSAGCAWRMLPHDCPKWKTVYHYFRQWRKDGTWEKIHERLRLWVRVSIGLWMFIVCCAVLSHDTKNKKDLLYCPNVGLWKELLVGLTRVED